MGEFSSSMTESKTQMLSIFPLCSPQCAGSFLSLSPLVPKTATGNTSSRTNTLPSASFERGGKLLRSPRSRRFLTSHWPELCYMPIPKPISSKERGIIKVSVNYDWAPGSEESALLLWSIWLSNTYTNPAFCQQATSHICHNSLKCCTHSVLTIWQPSPV